MPDEVVTGEKDGSYIEPASGSGGGEGASTSENGAAAASAAGSGESEHEHESGHEGGEGEGGEGEAAAPKAYESKTNFKYKVLQKEKEIPEKYRSLIKSEEDEKELRELFEKADGLEEHFKPKHEALQGTFNQLQAEHNYMLGHIDEARQAYQRGDMDAFFEKLQVPPQKVLQYAMEKLNYQELPPEQRAMIDARRNAERQNIELQRQQTFQQRQYQQQVQQAHNQLLNSELARPEVKSVMEAFDQRNGRAGAFLEEVNKRGQYEAAISNGRVILTPSQAIEKVMTLYGLKAGAPASAPAVVNPPASGGAQGKGSTIPNVGGGKSQAPVKQKPRSIEDLKKMHKEIVAREA